MTRISLDSSIFDNHSFIDWLIVNREEMEIYISSIAYTETFYWFRTRGLNHNDFIDQLALFEGQLIEYDDEIAQVAVDYAIENKRARIHSMRI